MVREPVPLGTAQSTGTHPPPTCGKRVVSRGALPRQRLFELPTGHRVIGGTDVKLGDPSEWGTCQADLVTARVALVEWQS